MIILFIFLCAFILLIGGLILVVLGVNDKTIVSTVVGILCIGASLFLAEVGVKFNSLPESTKIEHVIWKDDIRNPNNAEFVNEVIFNINDTLVIKDFDKTIQYEFCKRYYNDLDTISKQWFNQQ